MNDSREFWSDTARMPNRARSSPARGLAAGLVLGLTALFAGAAQAQTTVPAGWELNPAGLGSGDSFRLLFLSSDTRNATSSDIGVYNTFVQNLAANGHPAIQTYAAGFRVVGCTNAVDARDNTSTTGTPDVPIYWLNGPKIADDYADFYDGSWDNESNASDRDEDGVNSANTSVSFSRPYTGCADDGTEEFFGGDSRALGESTVRQGRLNGSGGPIDGNASLNAAAVRRFYGLSAVFTIAVPVIPDPDPDPDPEPDPEPDPAVAQSATVDGRTLTVTFDKALQESLVPEPWTFEVRAGDERHDVDTVGIEGAVLTLTLVQPVGLDQAVTLTYRRHARSKKLTDVDGIPVSSFHGLPVQPSTPTPAMPFAAVVVLALLLARRGRRALAS